MVEITGMVVNTALAMLSPKSDFVWTPHTISVDREYVHRVGSSYIQAWSLGGSVRLDGGIIRSDTATTCWNVIPAVGINARFSLHRLPRGEFQIAKFVPVGIGFAGLPCPPYPNLGRWEYEHPVMFWADSCKPFFFAPGDPDNGPTLTQFRDDYLGALSSWYGAQSGAPQKPLGYPALKIGETGVVLSTDELYADPASLTMSLKQGYDGTAPTLLARFQPILIQGTNDVDLNTYAVTSHLALSGDSRWATCLGLTVNQFVTARVTFNTYNGMRAWNNVNDQANSPSTVSVWRHEFGHVLGLQHWACNEAKYGGAIMWAATLIPDTWTKISLTDLDRDALWKLLPREQAVLVVDKKC